MIVRGPIVLAETKKCLFNNDFAAKQAKISLKARFFSVFSMLIADWKEATEPHVASR